MTQFADLASLREARRAQAAASRESGARESDSLPTGRLTTKQFNRHLAHVLEEQTRSAIAKYVGDVHPTEVLDLARRVAKLRARYVATALAAGGASAAPTKAEIEEMRFMRERIEELEYALATVREAIANEVVQVENVIAD
ncbi:hypothetical protein [Roseospira marina]|uniref:hypothetical protein n=1 Tax=Roseospira marina TaxID=140057 RepID=UPI001618AE13|nr:hypothetical protein [Roseospira marina]MBB4313713.1 hypothetical protein [Roseospira marina]MBB5086875.1 hypothetical protein [Roseospira marina]